MAIFTPGLTPKDPKSAQSKRLYIKYRECKAGSSISSISPVASPMMNLSVRARHKLQNCRKPKRQMLSVILKTTGLPRPFPPPIHVVVVWSIRPPLKQISHRHVGIVSGEKTSS